jgi:membrane protein YdbS with pleckstrin-like domain
MRDDDFGKSDPPRPLIATGAVAWICMSLVLVVLIAGVTVLGIYAPDVLEKVIHAAATAVVAGVFLLIAIVMVLKA